MVVVMWAMNFVSCTTSATLSSFVTGPIVQIALDVLALQLKLYSAYLNISIIHLNSLHFKDDNHSLKVARFLRLILRSPYYEPNNRMQS